MRYQAGQDIRAGGRRYRVEHSLGSGALSEVYQVRPDGVDTSIVFKVLRDDQQPDSEEAQGLRQEAQVLRRLNEAEKPESRHLVHLDRRVQFARDTEAERLVVMLLDAGELESGEPFQLQELAPPQFEVPIVETLDDERQVLAVVHIISRVIVMAHDQGLALKDFEPRTKIDRIRVRWLDHGQGFAFKLVDWNITGGPEDFAADLFFLGEHLYHFLLGRFLTLGADGQPPANLGIGVPTWETISEGSRQILSRSLNRDPARRYREAAQLEADLAWLLKTIDMAREASTLRRLPNWAWSSKAEARYDRVLAVADLALKRDIDANSRNTLETLADEAKRKLENEIWQPIADCRSSLRGGLFSKALACFERALLALDPRSEAARMARILKIQAAAGCALKGDGLTNVLESPMWARVTHAVNAIIDQRWDEGKRRMREALELYPSPQGSPMSSILDLARAGQLLAEARDLETRAEEKRADASRDDWTQVYADKAGFLQQAIDKLNEATKMAPEEVLFEDALMQIQRDLETRSQLLDLYQEADTFRQQGEQILDGPGEDKYKQALPPLQSAESTMRRIVELDPQQYRAEYLLQDIRPRLAFVEVMVTVGDLLADGRYVDADERVERSWHILRQEREGRQLRDQVTAAAGVERQAGDRLDAAASLLRTGNVAQASEQVRRVLAMNGQLLESLSNGTEMPGLVGLHPFVLRPDLERRARELGDRAFFTEEQHRRIEEAWDTGDYGTIVAVCQQLDERYGLSPEERGWLERAQERAAALTQAEGRLQRLEETVQSVAPLAGFQALREILEIIGSDGTTRLRLKAANLWLILVRREEDLAEALAHISEGRQLFDGLPLAEALAGAQDMVFQIDQVQQDLPLGNALTDRDLKDRLTRLDERLALLLGPASWPAVQRRAVAWREEIVDYLTEKLRTRRDQARACLDEGRILEAKSRVDGARDLVPDRFWERLSADVTGDLEGIARRTGAMLGLKEAMEGLLQRLGAGELSFAQAAAELDELPALPEEIEISEVAGWAKEIRRAARRERAYQRRATPQNYAAVLSEQQGAIRLRRIVADSSYYHVDSRLDELEQALKDSIGRVAGELCQAAGQAAEGLRERPDASPDNLLAFYWQLRWLRAALPDWAGQAEKALEVIVGTVRSLAEALRNTIAQMDGQSRLETARKGLHPLKRLNDGLLDDGLVKMSRTAGGEPLVILPDLPADTSDDYCPQSLDASALDGIGRDLDALLGLAGRPFEAPAEIDAGEPAPGDFEGSLTAGPGDGLETRPEPEPSRGVLAWLQRLFGRKGAGEPMAPSHRVTSPPGAVGAPLTAIEVALSDIRDAGEDIARLKRILTRLGVAFDRLGLHFSSPALAGLKAELEEMTELARLLEEAELDRADGHATQALGPAVESRTLARQLDAGWAWLLGPEQAALKAAARALDQRLGADLQLEFAEDHKEAATTTRQLAAKIDHLEQMLAGASPRASPQDRAGGEEQAQRQALEGEEGAQGAPPDGPVGAEWGEEKDHSW